jgi:phage terminase Nu1 subunit (DNA packaging protein)
MMSFMNLPKKISTSGLATLLSINERTIGKLVDKKILRREARGTFDTVDAVAAYVAHREAVVAAEHGVGAYGKARVQLYLERARVARIKREELEGSLVSTAEMTAAATAITAVVRQRLLVTPSKIAPRLVLLKTVGEIQITLRDEIYEALEELSRLEVIAARKSKDVPITRARRGDEGENDGDAAA